MTGMTGLAIDVNWRLWPYTDDKTEGLSYHPPYCERCSRPPHKFIYHGFMPCPKEKDWLFCPHCGKKL